MRGSLVGLTSSFRMTTYSVQPEVHFDVYLNRHGFPVPCCGPEFPVAHRFYGSLVEPKT